MNEEDKISICDAIARQLITGAKPDRELTEKLIKGLCEEFNEVRERSFSRGGPDHLEGIKCGSI